MEKQLNHENLRNSMENYKKKCKNQIITIENQKNYENHRIPLEN